MNTQQNKAFETLKNGGIVAYPTDTTFGVGCAISRLDAIQKIFNLKGRDFNKPLSIACSSLQMAKKYGDFSSISQKLLDQLYPGAVTLIVPKTAEVPSLVTSGYDKVGIRIPNYPQLLEIIEALGEPIITTSANLSGEKDPTTPEEITLPVDYLLEGECIICQPSTIIDLESRKIVRQGADFKKYSALIN